MARKTGKTIQTWRVFRQIVQTWRENQDRSRRALIARQLAPPVWRETPSTPSVSAQETRYPHEMDTGLKSLATRARARTRLTCGVVALARTFDLQVLPSSRAQLTCGITG